MKKWTGVFLAVLIWQVFGCSRQPVPVSLSPLPTQAPTKAVTATPSKPSTEAATKVPSQAPTKPSWQEKWDKTVAAAKEEGKVVVYGSAGGDIREALVKAFNERYGIPVEYLASRGPEIAQKILSEQRAGLYVADIILGASTPAVSQLKPAGALDHLEPFLVLPEVVDPKVWWENEIPWVDKGHYIIAFLAFDSCSTNLVTNSDIVKRGEIKGFRDLLDPKWRGKMVMHDPTIEGRSNTFVGMLAFHNMMGGVDYLRQLASQEPFISRDHRLLAEWVARGKYPVGICIESEPIEQMKSSGAPLQYVAAIEGSWVSAGTGFLSLPKNAPHPNASAIFVNWLLSKEGLIVYSEKAGLQSARVDIPTTNLDPLSMRRPGVKYVKSQMEEFFLKAPDWLRLGTEVFGLSIK